MLHFVVSCSWASVMRCEKEEKLEGFRGNNAIKVLAHNGKLFKRVSQAEIGRSKRYGEHLNHRIALHNNLIKEGKVITTHICESNLINYNSHSFFSVFYSSAAKCEKHRRENLITQASREMRKGRI